MASSSKAMLFAMNAHKHQTRKYTGEPYSTHLAQVAGLVAGAGYTNEAILAVAWLHDCVEDQGVSLRTLIHEFSYDVAHGVEKLSDVEEGSRRERKRLARSRLSTACEWVQSIKTADLISNTASIVLHDPKFAPTYLIEADALLAALTDADKTLRSIAQQQVTQGLSTLPIFHTEEAKLAIHEHVMAARAGRAIDSVPAFQNLKEKIL